MNESDRAAAGSAHGHAHPASPPPLGEEEDEDGGLEDADELEARGVETFLHEFFAAPHAPASNHEEWLLRLCAQMMHREAAVRASFAAVSMPPPRPPQGGGGGPHRRRHRRSGGGSGGGQAQAAGGPGAAPWSATSCYDASGVYTRPSTEMGDESWSES